MMFSNFYGFKSLGIKHKLIEMWKRTEYNSELEGPYFENKRLSQMWKETKFNSKPQESRYVTAKKRQDVKFTIRCICSGQSCQRGTLRV